MTSTPITAPVPSPLSAPAPPSPITARSVEVAGFTDRLRAQGSRYHDRHPFHQRMNAGLLSRAQLQGWIANRFCYQVNLPRKDANILANCPVPAVRVRWIQRICDHDGTPGAPGGIEAWLRLGEAAGLPRDEMMAQTLVVPGVRFAVEAYVNFCRNRPWTEAVASSLTELFSPQIIGERMEGMLKSYDFVTAETLAYFSQRPTYFRNRLSQAPRDSEHALQVVTEYCVTPEQQDAAVAALSFKCDVLWSILDAIDHAYSGE
jgi:pyrroloquinoline-quinone synthase